MMTAIGGRVAGQRVRRLPDHLFAAVPARILDRGAVLLAVIVAVGAHVVAASRVGAWTASLGEGRVALAAAVARGSTVVPDPLPLTDRFAALQIAFVQTLLPTAGVPIVDAARWACLVFGTATALLVWPILRGLTVSPLATAAGMVVLGAAVPVLALHSGISAAAPAAVWGAAAAALAVHGRGRVALVVSVIAVLTSPVAAVPGLALTAHLVLSGTVGTPARLRMPAGVAAAVAAVVVAVLATGTGPLAGAADPEVSTAVTVAGVTGGLIVLAVAARVAPWLRPALSGAALLLAVALVPGPSRAAAALLVAPVLAMALAVVAEHLAERHAGANPSAALVALLVVLVLAVPAPALLAARPAAVPVDTMLSTWLTDADPDAVIGADALDRGELLRAGFPPSRLRAATDPPVPGELRLVTARPGADATGCPDGSAVAAVARGTGGAPTSVCRTDGAGPLVASERAARARFGTALAGNRALRLAPAAAAALRVGAVDPRLMLVLAAMTTAHRLTVADFPTVPLDDAAVPRRRAVLTGLDGATAASSELLRTWLTGQQPPFVPNLVLPTGSGLLVGYPAPPVPGLLPE